MLARVQQFHNSVSPSWKSSHSADRILTILNLGNRVTGNNWVEVSGWLESSKFLTPNSLSKLNWTTHWQESRYNQLHVPLPELLNKLLLSQACYVWYKDRRSAGLHPAFHDHFNYTISHFPMWVWNNHKLHQLTPPMPVWNHYKLHNYTFSMWVWNNLFEIWKTWLEILPNLEFSNSNTL